MIYQPGDIIYIPVAYDPGKPYFMPDYIKVHYLDDEKGYAACNYYKYIGYTPDSGEVKYKHIKEIKLSYLFMAQLRQLYSIREERKDG